MSFPTLNRAVSINSISPSSPFLSLSTTRKSAIPCLCPPLALFPPRTTKDLRCSAAQFSVSWLSNSFPSSTYWLSNPWNSLSTILLKALDSTFVLLRDIPYLLLSFSPLLPLSLFVHVLAFVFAWIICSML